MRLINANTLALEEFIAQPPPYAILSHTWGDDEVTFAEFASASSPARVHELNGYNKIQKVCQLATDFGIQYVWVDTCCIDKSSSSELSEAINSMYRWYRKSDACFAYMFDLIEEEAEPIEEAFSRCRWFTRGWTLQELIAPREVHFFDRSWRKRGTKTGHRAILSRITGVDAGILDLASTGLSSLGKLLGSTPVATKMRWASKRETTRPEDSAYCLLGIFNVHMPLLYGEGGTSAFRRLQEEIAKRSSDLSLFAWQADSSISRYTGLFSPSVACFSLFQSPVRPLRNEFTITNTGLRAQPEDGFIIFKDEERNEYFYAWPLLVSEQHTSYVVLLRLGTNRAWWNHQ